MTTYRKESFKEFLRRTHIAHEPITLDDDLPAAFNYWVGHIGIELMMAYAEKWHLEQILANFDN